MNNQFGNPFILSVPCTGTPGVPVVVNIKGAIVAGVDSGGAIVALTAFTAGLLPEESLSIAPGAANGMGHTDLYAGVMANIYERGHDVTVNFTGNIVCLVAHY